MADRSARMPTGRHFAVTWSIPDDFGGMTEAMLRRSRAFHRYAGVRVEVLTFDDRPDYPSVEAALRARGTLSDGVTIVNLYDWLRSHPLPPGESTPDVSGFAPLRDGAGVERRLRGECLVARLRRDSHGHVLQIDHLREDGSLVLSDRRDMRAEGTLGGRRVVLCDRSGRPVRSWRKIWGLYAAWLDELTAGEPSFLIVDSKTIARFIRHYRRRHVVTAHVLHASHRGPDGAVRESRRDVLHNPGGFDALAVLSRSQARDIRREIGPMPNLVVVPNGLGASSQPAPAAPRDRRRGVVVAGLTRRKRVSHAIRAVQSANDSVNQPVTLDIYGDGESRAALERMAADDPHIRFHGHDPHARDRLREASFLLVTAHSEGFPLTLVEAMASGCLPIAYDIDYGPADLIRDGRNGFIVPAGDIRALTRAIHTLLDSPKRRVEAMRVRAGRATHRFDDARVTRRWAGLFDEVTARRAMRGWTRMPRLRAALGRVPILRRATTATVRVALGLQRRAGRASPG